MNTNEPGRMGASDATTGAAQRRRLPLRRAARTGAVTGVLVYALTGALIAAFALPAVAADPPAKAGDPAVRVGVPTVTPVLIFTVTSRWAGATPYRLERDITARFEQALKTLPDVKQIRSTTLAGRAQTDITFDSRADASTIASAIRTRLDQIKTRLPREASTPLIAWRRDPPAP